MPLCVEYSHRFSMNDMVMWFDSQTLTEEEFEPCIEIVEIVSRYQMDDANRNQTLVTRDNKKFDLKSWKRDMKKKERQETIERFAKHLEGGISHQS